MEDAQNQNPQEHTNDDIIQEAEKAMEAAPGENEAPKAESAETVSADPKDAEIQQLKADVASLQANSDAYKDKFVRLMAEFDNFRRRSAKEQLDLVETANGKLLEKLSEVLDNFERAAHPDNNKQKDYDSFAKGIGMIHDQFAKILKDAGLEQLDPIGEEFDPNFHEALIQQPSETVPNGHVVTVFQKGYKLKNKLLKTAKVVVSSGKPQN